MTSASAPLPSLRAQLPDDRGPRLPCTPDLAGVWAWTMTGANLEPRYSGIIGSHPPRSREDAVGVALHWASPAGAFGTREARNRRPSLRLAAIRSAFSVRRCAGPASNSSSAVALHSPSQRSNISPRIARLRCAPKGLPLYRPVVSITDDQKSTRRTRWASQSGTAAANTGPIRSSARALA